MTGIVYCRVSSKEQVDGTSLVSQEAACRDYATSKGIEILEVFVEQGESAKFADRTQLLALIDYCQTHKGKVEFLIVWKIDRFARNVADHFSVKATLAKYGVRIVSVTEPIDANPEGKLMETILAGFAEFDNSVRTMRTVQGMRRKLQEGIFPWGPPLGYRSPVVANEKKMSPDLPDEPTFSMLRRAWREFATGMHTKAQMSRLMQSWGLAAANGRAMPRQTIHQLFTNRYYAAILTDPWSREEYPGRHVAMVSAEEFARVQRVIDGRNRSIPHQKDRPEFPLRGLVRCGACHCALTGAFSRGRTRRYAYYSCHNSGCPNAKKSIPAEGVHEEFTGFLDEIAPRPALMETLAERIIRAATKELTASATHRRTRQKRISDIDRQTAELIRMRAQGLITDVEYLREKQKLAVQRAALEDYAKRRETPEQVKAQVARIAAPLTALAETWRSLDPPFRKRFERIVLPGGYVVRSIRTADLGRLFSLFRGSEQEMSSEVPS
jgi:site-specific DNA recombinase